MRTRKEVEDDLECATEKRTWDEEIALTNRLVVELLLDIRDGQTVPLSAQTP